MMPAHCDHSPSPPAVVQAVARHGARPSALLDVLRDVQQSLGHLSHDVLRCVAGALGLSEAHVMGLATFFSLLEVGEQPQRVARVCHGPVCTFLGSRDARAALTQAAARTTWTVADCSCLGLCDRAPAALLGQQPCGPLRPGEAAAHLHGTTAAEPPRYDVPREGEVRIAMQRFESLAGTHRAALPEGAYEVLRDALRRQPQEVLQVVEASGLRGRGGAGYPVGRKWAQVAQQPARPSLPRGDRPGQTATKFVICNADESEPATFKDRVLLEGDPHLLLEGMALAAYAVGATQGIVYLRGEFAAAAQLLHEAIAAARRQAWLGNCVAGTAWSFDIQVHCGAGAYICGEETALLESLEGRRGEPRLRPPFPTTRGLFGQPTVVNNVETLCHVPAIVRHGAAWYRRWGTAGSPGTKVYCVTGHVAHPGAFEAPLGITLREAIDRFAGGMRAGSRFKMALTGGAAGTVVGPQSLDIPLDFEAIQRGVMLGSGGILVLDESVAVRDLLASVLEFFAVESCGKCTPCREGIPVLQEIVARLGRKRSEHDALAELEKVAAFVGQTSLCGLGRSVAWPIRSAIAQFADELARPC
jgi:NADH-quinone oxidoreductase subunit F